MVEINEEDALAPFLTPIRDLAQNFDINLGELLQEYLDKFGLSNIGAEEVLDGVNFAEAAIVLQQSANIYGKKVDYLWQVLMQVLDSFQRKKKQEEEAAAAQRKGKPANTGIILISPDFCELDDDETLFGDNVEINISPDYVPNTIQLLPKYYPQLEMKGAAEKKLALYGLINNVIGNKYDFRVNKYLSTDGLLIDEPELKINGSASVTMCDLVTKVENTQSLPSPDIKNVGENVHEYSDIVVPGPSNILSEQYEDIAESCDLSFENNAVSNDNVPKRKTRENKVEKINACHRKPDKIITLGSDPWKPWPVDKQVPNKKFVKAITYKVPPDLANLSAEENKKKVFDKDVHKVENAKYPSILSFFTENLSQKVEKKAGYFACVEFYDNQRNNIPPKGTLSPQEIEDMMKEMAKEFGIGGDDFDDVFEDDFEDNDFDDDDFDVDVMEPPKNFITPEEGDVNDLGLFPKNIKFPSSETLADTYLNRLQLGSTFATTSTYEEYSHEAFSVPALYGKPIPGLAAKVNEWHDAIRPKLQAASERGSFDIHAYGTKIIKKLQTNSFKSVPFKDITQCEQSEDVPRFFLATLMLANSHNVEISKSNNTPLAMDCMNLSLLSSARHHKVFDDCVVPEHEAVNVDT